MASLIFLKQEKAMLIAKLKSVAENKFLRSVSVLVGGTVFAQAIAVLALPLLTRLYSPQEFSTLAIFAAFLSMISVVAALRYEIAIPIPEAEERAVNLLSLALFMVFLVSISTGIIVIFFSDTVSNLVNSPDLEKYLALLPLAVALTGAYGVFRFWAVRKKAFGRIARTRVEQGLGGVLAQLLLGWLGLGSLGLIIGQIISNGAGFIGLFKRAFKEDRDVFRSIRIDEMKKLSLEYVRYPKYSAIEALTNSAAIQVPLILIASLVISEEVGFLMLAMRIMQTPMSLVGSSISQVYFSYAVNEHKNNQLGGYTLDILGKLLRLGVGPLIFLGMLAPLTFGYIFGQEWNRAGVLVAWMTPWFIFQFLASPVSMSLHVTNNQRVALVLQIFGLLMRILMVLASYVLFNGYVAEAYAISGFLFYATYLLIVCYVVDLAFKDFARVLYKSLYIIFLWVVFALLIIMVL